MQEKAADARPAIRCAWQKGRIVVDAVHGGKDSLCRETGGSFRIGHVHDDYVVAPAAASTNCGRPRRWFALEGHQRPLVNIIGAFGKS